MLASGHILCLRGYVTSISSEYFALRAVACNLQLPLVSWSTDRNCACHANPYRMRLIHRRVSRATPCAKDGKSMDLAEFRCSLCQMWAESTVTTFDNPCLGRHHAPETDSGWTHPPYFVGIV